MNSDGRLREDETIVCDIIVSPIEEEVSISNQLAGRLDIQTLDIAEGVWRLTRIRLELQGRVLAGGCGGSGATSTQLAANNNFNNSMHSLRL